MKKRIRYYLGDLFVTRRFYALVGALSVLFVIRFFVPELAALPGVLLLAGVTMVGVDYFLLFLTTGRVSGARKCPERFSNGDSNEVILSLRNHYAFRVHAGVIDEIPFQFQKRDLYFSAFLPPKGERTLSYQLRPVKRGSYQFGVVRVYVSTRLRWLERRFIVAADQAVKVYPSFLQLRKYQLMAEANRWSETGLRRKRQLGHSMEFEQIKTYVPGDDYRTLNWKATARTGGWMVNNYIEEKSQQIYCVIDKGRAMKMPFEGLSLLDYAVNASLVLSSVALAAQDRAGLITFSSRVGSFLAAEKSTARMREILEVLYNQKTGYPESDFERLYIAIRRHIPQRSLLILFTNFETLSALKRQEPYLRKMATHHRVVVVIFENTEITKLLGAGAAAQRGDRPLDIAGVYTEVIAEKFVYEKKLIILELQRWGIAAILSAPGKVTVNTLNKYLELKARQAI